MNDNTTTATAAEQVAPYAAAVLVPVPRNSELRRRLTAANERGATAVEYALLIALAVLAVTVGVDALEWALSAFFTGLQADVDGWV